VVASTLHQCLKYYREDKKKINSDVKPFNVAESHFTDAKSFEEDAAPKETILAAISSTGKGSMKNTKDTHIPPEDAGDGNIKPQQQQKKIMSRQFQSHLLSKQMSQQIHQFQSSGTFLSHVERMVGHHLANVQVPKA